uniref:Ig-like domain-containing protein n=1 Tax=Cyprinus carpio TaxID=7962 RepID=A0A8C1WQG1_CYPCA
LHPKTFEVYLLGPSHSDVRSGTSVILTCLVVGQTVRLFSIQWKVNGKLLNHDVDKQAPKEHNNGTQSRENIMRVSGTKWNNYDVFTCEVTHLCSNDRHQQNISKTRAHLPSTSPGGWGSLRCQPTGSPNPQKALMENLASEVTWISNLQTGRLVRCIHAESLILLIPWCLTFQ